MARNEGKISAKAAIALAAIVAQQTKRRASRATGEIEVKLRELALDIIDEIYWEQCSAKAQAELRAQMSSKHGELYGVDALRRLAGWVDA